MRFCARPARLAGAAVAVVLMASPGVASANSPFGPGPDGRQHGLDAYLGSHSSVQSNPTPSAGRSADDGDLASQFASYGWERTAPAFTVSGQALLDARQQAHGMPTYGGSWTEQTTKPYNAQPTNYTDPFWGNEGAGFSLVGGRTTALLETTAGTWLAGTADGGVWRSTDQGTTWTPVFDSMPTESIGALALAPDGSVWVGTGEANTNADSYAGTGVYRSTDDGRTWQPVTSGDGSNPIVGLTVFRIAFDPAGDAYAATDNGLYRYSATSHGWSEALAPAPANDPQPYYDNQVTDVAVVPGTGGNDVIAVVGWRGPLTADNVNGFYESTDGGLSFSRVTPTGDINAGDIGRTTFAYSADGSKLYAVVESPALLTAGAISNLQGVFVATGSGATPASVAGPWTKIADPTILANSGSADAYGPDSVGAQAWYNQDLAVDPANPNHVYVGLEEVFESTDGGTSWITASPYWNYPFSCDASTPPTCPNTTHPDQHAMMIADGKIVIGNDGGVYSRPLSDDSQDGNWTDLNATLRSWQYYDARAGYLPTGGIGIWGGMQDNGTALFDPNQSQMVEPAGGDGFDVIVNPFNANQMAGEYTDGTVYSSTDGGHSFNDYVSPTCAAQATVGATPLANCDPAPRFVTPLVQSQTNPNQWLIGGEFVWESNAGWNTTCDNPNTGAPCSWTNLFDTGAGHSVTALSAAGRAVYAAWVNGSGEPGPTFAVGLATNVGGWHQISTAGLPNRYIAGIAVDPFNPFHAVVVFNGYTRRWISGGGDGHVFETFDAGRTWTDIDGNLPDAPGDAVVISLGRLYVATDIGVFTAADFGHGRPPWLRDGDGGLNWSVLGSGLPAASVNDLTVGPRGTLYAATHGRGVWSIQAQPFPFR